MTNHKKELQMPIPVLFPPSVIGWVENIAAERGVSRSMVVRQAVEAFRCQIEGVNQG